jgi:hypothetical protein
VWQVLILPARGLRLAEGLAQRWPILFGRLTLTGVIYCPSQTRASDWSWAGSPARLALGQPTRIAGPKLAARGHSTSRRALPAANLTPLGSRSVYG